MNLSRDSYTALMDVLEHLEIIDSHEHLPAEDQRLATNPDFSLLFSHYCRGDLLAAGMPSLELERFYSNAPVDEKWQLFAPYYDRIADGSYCRAAHLAMERFYGLTHLASLDDAITVTKALRQANSAGLYRRVLKEACGIRVAVNYGSLDDDREYFAPVLFCTEYCEATKATIRSLEDQLSTTCATLSAYVEAVGETLRQAKALGCHGLKLHFAYMRDLDFAARTHDEAERVFLRCVEEAYGWRDVGLGYEERRPLQDYMVHRLAEFAAELDVPVVIHSALQANCEHRADDARPLRLWNLPHRFRRTDFVILHSGLPWMEDAALLAKHYPNVYLDMGWDHLMSPALSRRALCSWVDLVPRHKVIGFGGDYCVVEKVYGHLLLARQDLAAALASKVNNDGMSLARAEGWLRAMLWDNPRAVYRLAV